MDISDKLVEAVLPALIGNVSTVLKKSTDSIRVSLSTSISDHIQRTYERCSMVRTIVSHDREVSLKSIYVPNELGLGGGWISEDDIIGGLINGKKFVISAMAGQGKTFLSRYIALDLMLKPSGKIPILVNLRDIEYQPGHNENYDPLGFIRKIYKTCASINDIRFDNEDIFLAAMAEGAFILILDGFDEVKSSQRLIIGGELRSLVGKARKVGCIVTSRFGTGAEKMEGYTSLRIRPLTKNQSMEIIERSPYEDKNLKEEFKTEIDQRLHSTHRSFVEVPLLCLVMLLSYKRYGPISDRLTTFYSHAYSALFLEADAAKAGYIRDRRVPLSIEEFGRVFSAFCAKTFLSGKFSFSTLDILNEIGKSLSYYDLTSTSPSDFLDDLIESVCLIQRDGLELEFVHRTFQEYFCAMFLCNYNGKNSEKIIARAISPSRNANVGFMMNEINPVALEQKWTLPSLEKVYQFITSYKDDNHSDIISQIGSITQTRNAAGVTLKFERTREHWLWEIIGALESIYREFIPFEGDLKSGVTVPTSADSSSLDKLRAQFTKQLSNSLRREVTSLVLTVRSRAHTRSELEPNFF